MQHIYLRQYETLAIRGEAWLFKTCFISNKLDLHKQQEYVIEQLAKADIPKQWWKRLFYKPKEKIEWYRYIREHQIVDANMIDDVRAKIWSKTRARYNIIDINQSWHSHDYYVTILDTKTGIRYWAPCDDSRTVKCVKFQRV